MFTFSSSRFTSDPTSKSIVAEASDFNSESQLFQQLYADACDVGFAIKSDKTGKEAVFYHEKDIFTGPDYERELAGWTFLPTSETLKVNPNLKGWSVTIFND